MSHPNRSYISVSQRVHKRSSSHWSCGSLQSIENKLGVLESTRINRYVGSDNCVCRKVDDADHEAASSADYDWHYYHDHPAGTNISNVATGKGRGYVIPVPERMPDTYWEMGCSY